MLLAAVRQVEQIPEPAGPDAAAMQSVHAVMIACCAPCCRLADDGDAAAVAYRARCLAVLAPHVF